MHTELPRAGLTPPWMFVSDCRTIRGAFRASKEPAVSNLGNRSLTTPRSLFLGNPLLSEHGNTSSNTVNCSQRGASPTDDSPRAPTWPQREVRLYQTWRNPSWLHHSQVCAARSNAPRRVVPYHPFRGIRDAMLRFACMGLMLAGLGALHYLYQSADLLARRKVRLASAQLGSEIAFGRVVRCNPITGIRVKNVSVSKHSSNALAPFGTARYVDASVSGFVGLLLRRQPLQLAIGVERGSVTVSNIVTTEYENGKAEALNLEAPIRMLGGDWRRSLMGISLELPRLLQPSRVSFHHSRLRLQGTQQSPVRQSGHAVEMLNMSGRLDLSNRTQKKITDPQRGETAGNVIFVKGNFRGGGSARIGVSPVWNRDSSAETLVPSVTASLTCSKVNIGSIASFVSLPFKLIDGHCTGSIELELTPSVSSIPTMNGQADVRSLGLRFDPSPESPELRNLTGRVRFKDTSLVLDQVEGDLGSIPLEAEGRIDFVEGFNVVSHARPFDVNRVIDTFALDRFIPVEGSVIGKAVVRGELDEPFVSGWIKAVGNRARADRVLLKSAMMSYDWDAAAGNLLFPSIRAKVVGGGEVTGSGAIYFDMTQETPYGCWNEQHHARNPKAQYWNADVRPGKVVPSLPADDFDVDKWAPFRPYDSMEFKMKGSGVSGGNLLRWYGREYGEIASEAIGRISGSCQISGHADDANSRLVWRSIREAPAQESHNNRDIETPSNRVTNETEPVSGRYTTQFSFKRQPTKSNLQGAAPASNIAGMVPRSKDAMFLEEDSTEYLGGLVYMRLGDLPEARRVKVRTVLRDFHVKNLFAGDPAYRNILLRAPNVVSSMDTLFKGTVCMRPSWEDREARKSGRRAALDLVSVEGALAIRRLTLNGVAFRSVVSGSLSLSATDISISLTEPNYQRPIISDANVPPFSDGRTENGTELQSSLDKLEISLNARGLLNMCIKWGNSEMSASVSVDDKMHRVVQFHGKSLDLQQLSGECNPLYEDETMQGILNTSIKLDLTDQRGQASVAVTDLAVGPLHFGLAKGQFLLTEGEISMQDATIEQRLSKYNLDGKYVVRGETSDFECFVNVGVDRAHIRDLARLVEGGKAIMESMPHQHDVKDSVMRSTEATPWGFQSTSQFARQDSSVTYWEVPQDLPFSEQTKWYRESLQKKSDTDLSFILASGSDRTDTPLRMYHMDNHLSGRVSMHYASRRYRDKRKRSAVSSTDRGPLQVFGNTELSFNLTGRNWILGKNKIELMTVAGFLEDGTLSVGPVQIKGQDGFLADAECRVTNAGSVEGSVNLHKAPVSNFGIFQNAGFDATGDISGNFAIEGSISNPTAYGQMRWQDATVNGRRVSRPHADLVCSNGRCVINIDAEVGGKGRQRNLNDGETYDVDATEPIDKPFISDATLKGKTEVKSVSPNRRKDIDFVRARVSVPVKLFVHQYVLPRVPKGILPGQLDAIDKQVPFDDDWIFASVDVKRYGMVLLNAAIPRLGWIAGESDVHIRISGTQKDPEVEGTIKFRDGSMRPLWMVHPLHSLKGEVDLKETGLMLCKSLSGRCHGRGFSLRGGMFLTKKFEDQLEAKVKEMQEVISLSNSVKMKRKRGVRVPLKEAVSNLRQGRGGFRIETGGIPFDIENVCSGIVSGKFLLTGTVMKPEIDGSLLFSEGVISANRALTGASRSVSTKSGRPMLRRTSTSSSTESPTSGLNMSAVLLKRKDDKSESVEDGVENRGFDINLKHLKVSLGRNVRVVHSFLFNVLVAGDTSFSGTPTNPAMSGKINILSGNVSALPARWAIRKSESSYVSFVHNPDSKEDNEEPIIKLVLESDTIILRVSECEASTWMSHLSLSDKSGNPVSEGRWADALHASDDDNHGNRRRIVNMLTGLMINALVVGGEIGGYDWKVFPTYFGEALPTFSRSLSEKYGAGFQVDQRDFCFESNMFFDKSRGAQVMIKLAKALNMHFFGDQNRRSAKFELRLPGRR